MSKVVIIGAGAMGSAFALPCLDNNHDINMQQIDRILSTVMLHKHIKVLREHPKRDPQESYIPNNSRPMV